MKTAVDEALDYAAREVKSSLERISRIVGTDAAYEYSPEYREKLTKSLNLLIEVRELLGR